MASPKADLSSSYSSPLFFNLVPSNLLNQSQLARVMMAMVLLFSLQYFMGVLL